jgi:hypothetical protein
MMIKWLVAAALALGVAGTAQAQTVSAANPKGLLKAITSAGYEAELSTDKVGDPMIETTLSGYKVIVLFYGCDEKTHKGCDSVQFSTGFDRETPMDPVKALAIAREWRFLAVSLDDEGDPYLRWDVLTAGGIPQSVFMAAFRRYGETIESAADMIFEGE